MEFILTNTLLVYFLFFPKDIGIGIQIVRFMFSLYPPFSFSKVFGDIARITSKHYVTEEFKWIQVANGLRVLKGREFTWEDFISYTSGTLTLGDEYSAHPPLFGMLTLMGNTLLFSLLAWYFDHVVSANRGTGE